MRITLSLSLPRDETTVPIARHLVHQALGEVRVDPDCVGDIEVALSEACTNVLKHSGPGDEYDVSTEINDDNCIIRVVDTGRGFDSKSLGFEHAAISAEQGRGIQLMRALVDKVHFESRPEAGTIVHLEKALVFHEQSPVHRFGASRDSS